MRPEAAPAEPTPAVPTTAPPRVRGRSSARRLVRFAATVLAWLALAVALTGLLARLPDSPSQTVILLGAGAWLLGLAVVPAVLLFVLARRWWSLLAVLAVVTAQVVVYAPMFVAQTVPAGSPLTVMTQNARYGRADPAALVAAVRAEDVDVLFVEELTKGARTRLGAAGMDGVMPFSRIAARGGVNGLGIWSRLPLVDATRLPQSLPGGMTARVTVAGRVVTLVSLHLAAPWPGDSTEWFEILAQARTVLGQAGAGPALVAGDFNATEDQARFRKLLTGGWRDAAEQAGAGFVRSWPSGRAVPPLVGIDHVLVHEIVASDVHTVDIPGSDHRGLVVRTTVPVA